MDKRMFQLCLWREHFALCMCKCPYRTIVMVKSINHRLATPFAVDFVSQSYFVPCPTRKSPDVVGQLLYMATQSICQLMQKLSNKMIKRALSLVQLKQTYRFRHSNRAYRYCCHFHSNKWLLIRQMFYCPIVQHN